MMGRLFAMLATLVSLAGPAAADGAFPDSMSLLLPADRPQRMVVGTNFGLIVSDDDGANWYLVCEQAIAANVSMYQLSAAPDDRLYAATPRGLASSDDGGCNWRFAGGRLAGANVTDVWPDAGDPAGVFAIATTPPDDDGGSDVEGVYQSSDGGRSFGAAPLFTAGPAMSLTGVEKARAAPQTLYLTMLSYPPPRPQVASSTGGAAFAVVDESAFTAASPYLAAVDPFDARVLYLRLRGQGDALGISRDAGATIGTVLPMQGRMSALLRRANGTILVGSADKQSLRSVDGGQTFAPWPGAPHVRALAERGDVLYVVASDVADDFVVGRSADEGASWTPLLHFRDVRGPLPCGDLPAVCAAPWAALQGLFNPGANAADMSAAAPPAGPAPRRGCGCAVGGATPRPAPVGACVIVLVISRLLMSLTHAKKEVSS
jgi:hypothetical protein